MTVSPSTGECVTPRTIAVVGIDGSGKSTFVGILDKALKAKGWQVRLIDWFRDPAFRSLAICFNDTGTMTPEVLAALHAGSALALLQRANRDPAQIVLWDRYVYSSYASCCVRGAPPTLMRRLVAEFPEPDLTIHIVGEPRLCFQRIGSRGNRLRYYESGLDRLFRGRVSVAHTRFDSDDVPSRLVEEVFVETMREWNAKLHEIIPAEKCLRLVEFDLKDAEAICDQVLKRLALQVTQPA